MIAVHHGRVVKRTGDGALVEFRSVGDAVRCALEIQHAMVERNAGVPSDRRIDFCIGVQFGDVVESDGDLMGDGVNIAVRHWVRTGQDPEPNPSRLQESARIARTSLRGCRAGGPPSDPEVAETKQSDRRLRLPPVRGRSTASSIVSLLRAASV